MQVLYTRVWIFVRGCVVSLSSEGISLAQIWSYMGILIKYFHPCFQVLTSLNWTYLSLSTDM